MLSEYCNSTFSSHCQIKQASALIYGESLAIQVLPRYIITTALNNTVGTISCSMHWARWF